MKKIYVLSFAIITACLLGCLTGSSLYAQSTDEETPKSVNVFLHVRPAYHTLYEGKVMKFKDSGFKFDHVTIDIGGQITPKLSYKYLQRLNKNSPFFSKENLPSSIDYAYLKYAFNEHFSMTAGKQALSIGGCEYNKYPVDVYDYSGLTNLVTCYLTGVQASLAGPGQEFTFQVLNNRTGTWEEAVGIPRTGMDLQAPGLPLYYSLGWNSNYFDNALQLRYAANMTTPAKGKPLFMLSSGQKFESGPFSIYIDAFYQYSEIDYLGGIRSISLDKDSVVENVKYFSLLGEVNYRFTPKLNLMLKCFYNNFSTYKSTNYIDEGNCLTSWNYQAGLEFYPMKDDNLHLFLISTMKNYSKPAITQVNPQKNEFRISAGLIYRIPVLSLKR